MNVLKRSHDKSRANNKGIGDGRTSINDAFGNKNIGFVARVQLTFINFLRQCCSAFGRADSLCDILSKNRDPDDSNGKKMKDSTANMRIVGHR